MFGKGFSSKGLLYFSGATRIFDTASSIRRNLCVYLFTPKWFHRSNFACSSFFLVHSQSSAVIFSLHFLFLLEEVELKKWKAKRRRRRRRREKEQEIEKCCCLARTVAVCSSTLSSQWTRTFCVATATSWISISYLYDSNVREQLGWQKECLWESLQKQQLFPFLLTARDEMFHRQVRTSKIQCQL